MTTLQSIRQTLAPELDRLNECIASSLSSNNELMNQVVDNYLKVKGKQIRPILVMLSAMMYAPVNDNVISGAAAVELLHNASLIHDDVIDDTVTRRNRPTINGIWDNHIAVLVGDYFVSTALQHAINTSDQSIIRSICSLGKLLSLGEIDQIYNARYNNLSEDAYLQVIDRKTASLFVACVEIGCHAVDAPEEMIEVIAKFARLLGLCFQIKDDIFDYGVNGEQIGKPVGNDLREGKVTLPLLHVLLDAGNPESEKMTALSRKDLLTTEDIEELYDFARSNGGIDYAYDYMAQLRDEAFLLIDTLPESNSRRLFKDLFNFVIERES